MAPPITNSADSSTTDYSYEMNVSAPKDVVMSALTDDHEISEWWPIFSQHERDDAEFRFIMGDMGLLAFAVDVDASASSVKWAVSACDVLPDWIGTTPTFELRPKGDGTTDVSFRHVGLNPAVECFETCSNGWNRYMPSLFDYLQAK
jgi:hypothetical protein